MATDDQGAVQREVQGEAQPGQQSRQHTRQHARQHARQLAALTGLTFCGAGLDRCAEERAIPDLLATVLAQEGTRVVEFAAGEFAVKPRGPEFGLRWRAPVDSDRERLAFFLGRGRGPGSPAPATDSVAAPGPAYVAVVNPAGGTDPEAAGEGSVMRPVRSIAVHLDETDATIVATASALANWHASHGCCSRCGTPTEPVHGGWIRRCPADGSEHYPRTDPAVIMAVTDADDRLLLARGAGFTTAGMSVLAGFVEPGESLAQSVIREVAEEVGLDVTEVEYLGDQPWPFPNGLMIGFRARALGTQLRLQDGEIESARWFTRDEFAQALADGTLQVSGRLSISRRLIEHWWGAPLDVPDAVLRR